MKITDEVYCLQSAGMANAFLIKREHTILIDTGLPHRAQALLAEIASLGVDPKTIGNILLTHHDIDHVGNAAALGQATGATLWIGRKDAPYLLGEQTRPGRKRFLAALMGVRKPDACRHYEENSVFDGIKAIAAPGHTPGHHILQFGKIVFIGDLFRAADGRFVPMNPAMNSDAAQLCLSIGRLAGLDFDLLCPAHGSPVQRTAELDAFLRQEGDRT